VLAIARCAFRMLPPRTSSHPHAVGASRGQGGRTTCFRGSQLGEERKRKAETRYWLFRSGISTTERVRRRQNARRSHAGTSARRVDGVAGRVCAAGRVGAGAVERQALPPSRPPLRAYEETELGASGHFGPCAPGQGAEGGVSFWLLRSERRIYSEHELA
jgi:hypothetical protein